MQKYSRIALFIDTNYFYNYPSIEQVKWTEAIVANDATIRCEHVLLVIVPVVIRELNDHKDSGRKPALSERAATSLLQIRKFLRSTANENGFPVRENVDLLLEPRDAEITYPRQRYLGDDQLIQNALLFKEENPDTAVFLLTEDVGLELKALSCGILHAGLPDKYKTAPRDDPRDRKMREQDKLIKELSDLRPPEPNFSIKIHAFDAAGNGTEPQVQVDLIKIHEVAAFQLLPLITNHEAARHVRVAPRTVLIRFVIENFGTAPATNFKCTFRSSTLNLFPTRHLQQFGIIGPQEVTVAIERNLIEISQTLFPHTHRYFLYALIEIPTNEPIHEISWSCYSGNRATAVKGAVTVNAANLMG